MASGVKFYDFDRPIICQFFLKTNSTFYNLFLVQKSELFKLFRSNLFYASLAGSVKINFEHGLYLGLILDSELPPFTTLLSFM